MIAVRTLQDMERKSTITEIQTKKSSGTRPTLSIFIY